MLVAGDENVGVARLRQRQQEVIGWIPRSNHTEELRYGQRKPPQFIKHRAGRSKFDERFESRLARDAPEFLELLLAAN